MLKRFQIRNYRCFPHVDVPLGPVTVLIGANDTGKSSFLTALEYFAGNRGFVPSDFWRKDQSKPIAVEGQGTNDASFRRGSQDSSGELPPIVPMKLYRLPPQGIPMESPGYPDDP